MNTALNYDELSLLIQRQLVALFGNVEGYQLFVEQEREFTKEVELHPNGIYIVISFGTASTNFGQSEIPVFLECVSEENSFIVARDLLSSFVVTFNNSRNGSVYQQWESPTLNSKFNEVGKGFRSMLYVSGSMSIGAQININDIAKIYWKNGDDYEEIQFLSFNEGYQASLQPQVYPDQNGFAKSQAEYATYTISFSTFPLTGEFFQKINEVKYSGGHENDSFTLKLVMVENDTGSPDDDGYEIEDMRLLSANMVKNLGENATIALVFTR